MRFTALILALALFTGTGLRAQGQPAYAVQSPHDPDGIGKFYMGREISLVMGHEGADWLERPERDKEEHTTAMVESLEITPGSTVADIGAGTGYFTRSLARLTGPSGRVYAVDVQPEMLTLLTNKLKGTGITNVVAVLGSVTNANLPAASIDLALLVDVYHEFEFPFEMIESITQALKPGGCLALVEYRGEDPKVPIKPLHKMTEDQVLREMANHSLTWVQTIRTLPQQNIFLFKRSAAANAR